MHPSRSTQGLKRAGSIPTAASVFGVHVPMSSPKIARWSGIDDYWMKNESDSARNVQRRFKTMEYID